MNKTDDLRVSQKIRALNPDLVKYYEISINDLLPLSDKAYKIADNSGEVYFLKETDFNALEKYQFLANQGISNVLYPNLNIEKKYVTRGKDFSIYLNNYVESITVSNEMKAKNMFNEINRLHDYTSFKRQLSPAKSRAKFDEISNRLDFKFRVIESYIRSVETNPLNMYSMPVLANYQYILDAKKELVRLQKRLISSIKARESVEYNYIHNKPRLDHIINVRGVHYLTSIEHGKVGISSLDMAKFYIENEDLNIDFGTIIKEYYYNIDNPFYYDYFRYLVLLIYVNKINIRTDQYLNAQEFVDVANSVKKYFETFSDYQEQVSQEY